MRTAEEIISNVLTNKSMLCRSIPVLTINEAISLIDEARKEAAIHFFKWNAEKIAAYVIYLQDVQKIVRSNEIEENLVKFECETLEERYDMYLEYLNKKSEIETEIAQ